MTRDEAIDAILKYIDTRQISASHSSPIIKHLIELGYNNKIGELIQQMANPQELGLLNYQERTGFHTITNRGRDIIDGGGWLEYRKSEKEKQDKKIEAETAKEEREKLQHEKTKLDIDKLKDDLVKSEERHEVVKQQIRSLTNQNKVFWFGFGFSIVALLFSGGNLYLQMSKRIEDKQIIDSISSKQLELTTKYGELKFQLDSPTIHQTDTAKTP